MILTLQASLVDYVRGKVASGVYQNESEVVEDSLFLLQQHDSEWKTEASAKIDQGLRDLDEGRVLSSEQSKTEMTLFKTRWKTGA